MRWLVKPSADLYRRPRLDTNQLVSIPRFWFGMGEGNEEIKLDVYVHGRVDVNTDNPRGAAFGTTRDNLEYGRVNFWGHSILVLKIGEKWEAQRRYSTIYGPTKEGK